MNHDLMWAVTQLRCTTRTGIKILLAKLYGRAHNADNKIMIRIVSILLHM